MAKNLRWKVLVILGVIALSVWSFYPPDRKVKLGLDLKGGVQMIYRVETDDALVYCRADGTPLVAQLNSTEEAVTQTFESPNKPETTQNARPASGVHER